MSLIQPQNRYQVQLPCCIDDYIPRDNPVRLIDSFVDKAVRLHPKLCFERGQNLTFRSTSPFGSLLKLYIYGYLNSVSFPAGWKRKPCVIRK
ncbi:MAG: hypothetical protein QM751_10685 [Paludibacteraceae bacterium]